MKLAVTAANGQLGSVIVNEAITQLGRQNIIGIARNPEKATHLGVEIRQGDYNNRDQYQHALKGTEVVLLVSGMDAPDKRIEQHRNVINAARTAGVSKLVYTSIFGEPGKGAFDPIIQANRQTEKDIMDSGLDWSVGRNGLYLEADLEYLDHYFEDGKISNCAGEGRCAYTTRDELARAYLEMVTRDELNGSVYNLVGEAITQQELVDAINLVYGSDLKFESMSVSAYRRDRTAAHGDEFGTIISGIYEGIRNGAFEIDSDYRSVTGREHISVAEYIKWYKLNH
jgi:NAD(P)H dehydrogenase (quinone)